MYPNLNAEEARYGLTLKDMAEIIGCTERTYCVKKKTEKFTLKEAEMLCKKFSCTHGYLFSLDPISPNL